MVLRVFIERVLDTLELKFQVAMNLLKCFVGTKPWS